MIRVVRNFNKLPREAGNDPSLNVLKLMLDGFLSNLI